MMTQSRILYTPRQQKRKRKRFSKEKFRIMLVLISFVALLAGCVSVVRLSYFQIREIKVSGSGTEQDAQELQTTVNSLLLGNYALVIPKRFIFGVSAQNLEQRLLAALPRFETISVTRQFPHALSVSYAKRIFFALLCNDDAKSDQHSCGYMDRTGFIYEDAPEASGSLIVKIKSDLQSVKVGTQAIGEATVRQMVLFGESIQRTAGLRLLAYELSTQTPDELRLKVAEGFTLIVKKDSNPDVILPILHTVLTQEIKDRKSQLDYINLRFGNKVFYKYKLR